jgi:hypothetical protein
MKMARSLGDDTWWASVLKAKHYGRLQNSEKILGARRERLRELVYPDWVSALSFYADAQAFAVILGYTAASMYGERFPATNENA